MLSQGETKQESRGPYVIYCRRSTDEENKQKDSISAQIKACIDYWERSGNFDLQHRTEALDLPLFNIDGELQKEHDRTDAYHEYLEKVNGYIIIIERASAKSSKQRKKWTKLVNLASKGKIKGILSYSPDRCSRNMLEAGELIDLVDNTDLDLKFTNFHFEKTPSGKMMLAVLFGFAKHYSDNRSELSKRGHSNKGDRGEALGPSKYGYIINEDNRFEPHPKYRDLMQMAFTMKIHQGLSDIKIAKRLNDEGFKVRTKVGKRAKEYGKVKFKEHKIRASNLGPVWIDPFYYGILVYGEGRYDQRDLNASYGKPMITESDHNILIGRSNAEHIKSKKRETKEGNDLLRPFPIGMVVTERGETIHGGANNLKRDHYPRLKKLKEVDPKATLVDVIEPKHIKYAYKKGKTCHPVHHHATNMRLVSVDMSSCLLL